MRRRARRDGTNAGSLVVTIFGDLIVPRGGVAAYATLAAIAGMLGVNDSQLRTALSRLVAEGWLEPRRAGKRAFYALAPEGAARTREAARRIYAVPEAKRAGPWRVAIFPPMPARARAAARRPFEWIGFASAGPTTMIHPDADPDALASVLASLPDDRRPAIVAGPAAPEGPARALIARAWDLPGLGRAWSDLARRLAPAGPGPRDPERCLRARLILIHEFRRLALRDPGLPAGLLPRDWPGTRARARLADRYRALLAASEAWLDAHGAGPDGKLPRADKSLRRRFAAGHMSQVGLQKRSKP
ncbi:MAG: phenylacetic acid degradation operon negative regulatory protein PaaX [Magnetospirillum sp.]|nr:phenylacetic acid degradation operon negative regulatory protein PaaX [Magnetospirillum sp.]